LIARFERLFYGFWSDSSSRDVAVALSSAFASHSGVYLDSFSGVSLLSVDELDTLLWSEPFMVDGEAALLRVLFACGHPPLIRHIRWEFVSTAAIASPCEDPALCHPKESLSLVEPIHAGGAPKVPL
jgi:hypothetical protein